MSPYWEPYSFSPLPSRFSHRWKIQTGPITEILFIETSTISYFRKSVPPDISDTYSLLVLNITFRTTAKHIHKDKILESAPRSKRSRSPRKRYGDNDYRGGEDYKKRSSSDDVDDDYRDDLNSATCSHVPLAARGHRCTLPQLFVFLLDSTTPVAEDDETSTVVVTSNLRHTQGGENLDIKDDSVSCSSLKSEEENTDDNEDSSSPELFLHPCQYFQLATVAFLKCFGLDSTLDPSSTCRRRKRKES
nr:uncharacterized protein LOC112786105 [Arachis hypogaea]